MNWFIKYLIITAITIWLLVLMGCKHISCTECIEEEFTHTCPQAGHGECPICTKPEYRYKHEKIIALDSK